MSVNSLRRYTFPTTTFSLSGASKPGPLAVDSQGNLYVFGTQGVSPACKSLCRAIPVPRRHYPRQGSPKTMALAKDGTLYVGYIEMIQRYTPNTSPLDAGLTIRASEESLPMSLGETTTPRSLALKISLRRNSLRSIPRLSGTLTIGDTKQTGNITFTAATPVTTAGAALAVVQNTTGSGQIILDDGSGTATALTGTGGTMALTAGTGGIVAADGNNHTAEYSSTNPTVTLLTTGPIGTSANPIQFADNTNIFQQNVTIGSSTLQPAMRQH